MRRIGAKIAFLVSDWRRTVDNVVSENLVAEAV